MTSVLRKKIEAGAGISPTILQCSEFWDALQIKVGSWAFETFATEFRAIPDARRVVAGNVATGQLDGLLSFVFNAKFSPGICAIAIDEMGAGLNAALRLQQPADDLDGISPLFRKLLFETQAIALWRSLATGLSDHLVVGSQAPFSEYPQAAGGFDPAERYLMVGYTCAIKEQRTRFWIVYHLDHVQRRAAEFERMAAQSRGASAGKGRDALRASVKSSTIMIDGVLDEISMTIGQCSRLEVGQVITLADVDTANVSLRAETVNGTVDIGKCEMGVWKQQRALKLKTPILEPFTRELARL
jgi:Type III flagellar switch regulator (C-ring) FliN C-term